MASFADRRTELCTCRNSDGDFSNSDFSLLPASSVHRRPNRAENVTEECHGLRNVSGSENRFCEIVSWYLENLDSEVRERKFREKHRFPSHWPGVVSETERVEWTLPEKNLIRECAA